MRPNPRDLGFQQGDARAKLIERIGLEILRVEKRSGVLATACRGKKAIIVIHWRSIGPLALAVNRPRD